jgi:hypothetical protein
MRSQHTSPYIVTAYRNGPWPHTSHQRDVLSRRAVATLEEAREQVADELRALTADQPSRVRHPLFDRAYDIGMSGDALQLPDGTVIEVKRVYWDTLVDGVGFGGNEGQIIAAFNAQELA